MIRRTVTVNSPSMRRIVSALERHGPMDYHDIALEANVGVRTLTSGDYLQILAKAGLIHIVKWDRDHNGPPTPIYAAGPGRNKPKPRPYTAAEKAKRWKKRANYNRNMAEARQIMNAYLGASNERDFEAQDPAIRVRAHRARSH